MARFSMDKRMDKIANGMVKSGWREVARNRHVKLQSPDGVQTVIVALTPSDGRATLNWICQLKRMGIDVEALERGKHSKEKMSARQVEAQAA